MNKRLILYHIVEKMWLSMREKLLKEFLFDDVVACKYRILHAFLSFFLPTPPLLLLLYAVLFKKRESTMASSLCS